MICNADQVGLYPGTKYGW